MSSIKQKIDALISQMSLAMQGVLKNLKNDPAFMAFIERLVASVPTTKAALARSPVSAAVSSRRSVHRSV